MLHPYANSRIQVILNGKTPLLVNDCENLDCRLEPFASSPDKMKLLIMLSSLVALLTGCSMISTRHINAENVTSLDLSLNEVFTIDIKGNATTGFVWNQVEDEESSKLLECIGKSYETVKAKRNLCGAPGVFYFQYRAKAKGKCLLRFEYSRPWEKDAPPANTKEIVITVQ